MSPERLGPPNEAVPGLRVQLAHVALMSTPRGEIFGYPQDDIRYLDVFHESPRDHEGPIIGTFKIKYFPLGIVKIHDARLEEEFRNKGLGIEMYRSVPFLPLLDGGDFRESGARFRSDASDSDDGKRVWRSLARHGFASYLGRSRYQMRVDIPRPDVMIVEEIAGS